MKTNLTRRTIEIILFLLISVTGLEARQARLPQDAPELRVQMERLHDFFGLNFIYDSSLDLNVPVSGTAVDIMIKEGLVEETQELLKAGVFQRNATAAQAIGYKEILPYCRGESQLSDAVETLKTATRRYAKRQMTWFGAKEYVSWIEIDEQKTFEEIVNNSIELFKN